MRWSKKQAISLTFATSLLASFTSIANSHLLDEPTGLTQLPYEHVIEVKGRTLITEKGLAFSWPGVSLATTIDGSKIAVTLDGPKNYFDVKIGSTQFVLETKPGKHTYLLADNLSNHPHKVILTKRNEDHFQPSYLVSWHSDKQNSSNASSNTQSSTSADYFYQIKQSDKARIQFFTDSHGAGYGNESPTRECSQDEIRQYTNHLKAYPSLVAKHFDADNYSQSYSGAGIVRNWGGHGQKHSFLSFSDSVLLGTEVVDNPTIKEKWQWSYANDKASLIVIELGHNDFTTALRQHVEHEKWSNLTALKQDYIQTAKSWIQNLASVYGKETPFVMMSTRLYPEDHLTPLNQQIVSELHEQGIAISYLNYASAVTGQSCQWHPSAKEHQAISALLIEHIENRKINL
ncbi:hypothetical protein HR060_15310 [Catenovulum sp. SM1970]|uniref:SGNH/GDSL hydrolase family protein n=1 Tax=Marinifaba aquimaris TaxID=2741323 RepID=UPI0015745A8F|nr:SGNH/GDSL hydrolase family protein [Marinifaba aquimaris]NTS78219.1 hypothetical protein [Marinifaba aquimaris]